MTSLPSGNECCQIIPQKLWNVYKINAICDIYSSKLAAVTNIKWMAQISCLHPTCKFWIAQKFVNTALKFTRKFVRWHLNMGTGTLCVVLIAVKINIYMVSILLFLVVSEAAVLINSSVIRDGKFDRMTFSFQRVPYKDTVYMWYM